MILRSGGERHFFDKLPSHSMRSAKFSTKVFAINSGLKLSCNSKHFYHQAYIHVYNYKHVKKPNESLTCMLNIESYDHSAKCILTPSQKCNMDSTYIVSYSQFIPHTAGSWDGIPALHGARCYWWILCSGWKLAGWCLQLCQPRSSSGQA